MAAKFPIDEDTLKWVVKKLPKINSIRLRNIMLRTIHADIYSRKRLCEQGMIESDDCVKCGMRETLEHLLHECWYSGRIWTKLIQIYKKADSVPQQYQVSNDFVLGSHQNKARITLHLEIIRLLQNKNRPAILPRTLINQALVNLKICEPVINDKLYYNKLQEILCSI